MDKTIGQRIVELLEKRGMNQSDLARAINVKPQTIQQWISGETTPKEKNLRKTAKVLTATAEYLRYGSNKDDLSPNTDAEYNLHKTYKIPQYDTHAAMGNGLILPDQPGVIQSWNVSKDWISKNVKGYQSVNGLCIVTGFGDSMRPLFNPGDPLLVDTSVNTVNFDGIYFFRVDNEGFIKRLQRIPGEGLRVLSENRERYEHWTIKDGMNFEVLGRVLKVWCSEDF